MSKITKLNNFGSAKVTIVQFTEKKVYRALKTDKNCVIFSATCFLCILQTRMSKITKLNNFGSTKVINLKLTPVTGVDNKR